jgi:hypothetical protein
MITLGNDLRLAARRLARQPGFAAVAITTLALGLGVNTAIFTIARALTAQQLPVREPSALYRFGDGSNCCVNSGLQDDYALFSTQLYEHLRDTAADFSSVAGFQANVTATSVRRAGADVTESVPAQFVSGNYFETLGVLPHLGRLLAAPDDHQGSRTVFVISHRRQLHPGGEAGHAHRGRRPAILRRDRAAESRRPVDTARTRANHPRARLALAARRL